MRFFLSAFLLALPAAAADSIWFDPPNPDSRTPITAHFRTSACVTPDRNVSLQGHRVTIAIKLFACGYPPPLDGFLIDTDLGVLPAGVYQVEAVPERGETTIASATLPVRDAAPPFRLMPDVASQPDNITISGLSLPACAIGACALPIVTFGGVEAQVVLFQAPNVLVVRAPIHDPGTIDVVVSYQGTIYRATAAFNFFISDGDKDPAFFEPVLFPVVVTGAGAFGSYWLTDLSMFNDNDYTFPVHSIFDAPLGAIPDTRPGPHSVGMATSSPSTAYLLSAPRQSVPRLFFGLLIRDVSKQSETLGTQIPVVRENDFFDRPFQLLNVPTTPRNRTAMRFYRIDGGTTVHYRIRPLRGEAILVDTVAALAPVNPDSQITSAFIGDLLVKHPELRGIEPLRIEIDAPAGHRATWAFVSVTNNQTQYVTVISPQ